MLRHSLRGILRSVPGVLAGVSFAAGALAQDGFQTPARGDMLTAGSRVEVRWSIARSAARVATEAELVLSVDGGLTFPIRVSPEMAIRATAFRWHVPALPTARARLALRTGSGAGSAGERLDLVSQEFSIFADSSEAREPLVRGAVEWWTRQAVSEVAAVDKLSETMARAGKLVASEFLPDVGEPDPPGVEEPQASAVSLCDDVVPARTGAKDVVPRGARLRSPLRL